MFEQAFKNIKHFAGDVLYSGSELIPKNNDSLHSDLRVLLGGSESDFVVNVCTQFEREGKSGYVAKTAAEAQAEEEEEERQEKTKGKRASQTQLAAKQTVTSKFRGQLDNLVDTLTATEPHYIKCIKPNGSKSASTANDKLVLEQLRYSGVLEVVRIRREGFPLRMGFGDFHKRFEILCFKDGEEGDTSFGGAGKMCNTRQRPFVS